MLLPPTSASHCLHAFHCSVAMTPCDGRKSGGEEMEVDAEGENAENEAFIVKSVTKNEEL